MAFVQLSNRHAHHLVQESPWPLMSSLGAFSLVVGFLSLFSDKSWNLLMVSLLTVSLSSYQWWRDVTLEGSFLGLHSLDVESGIRLGMILFITSEVFLFLSFFWAYFHSSISPELSSGDWPPAGVEPFNVFEVPLLNTLILLSSGVSLTWSHHFLLAGNSHLKMKSLLFLTVILGVFFTCLQAMEYYEAPFTFADGVYGSVFFIATGFHGAHVLIGTCFLFICLLRMKYGHYSYSHHFGFEAAAWYWHFVDVVWLFLFISIYWWGS